MPLAKANRARMPGRNRSMTLADEPICGLEKCLRSGVKRTR
jgi:hypothetical protein